VVVAVDAQLSSWHQLMGSKWEVSGGALLKASPQQQWILCWHHFLCGGNCMMHLQSCPHQNPQGAHGRPSWPSALLP
jgi:hypothetical protein